MIWVEANFYIYDICTVFIIVQLKKLNNILPIIMIVTTFCLFQSNFREHRLAEAQSCCVQYLEKLREIGVGALFCYIAI